MPSRVVRFEQLMYASLGIGVVIAVLEANRLAAMAGVGVGFLLVMQLLLIALFVLLIWLIARRRKNWARWVILIFFLLGLPMLVPDFLEMLDANPIVGLLSAIQVILQIAALCFLFTGNSRVWFKPSEPSAATSSAPQSPS